MFFEDDSIRVRSQLSSVVVVTALIPVDQRLGNLKTTAKPADKTKVGVCNLTASIFDTSNLL